MWSPPKSVRKLEELGETSSIEPKKVFDSKRMTVKTGPMMGAFLYAHNVCVMQARRCHGTVLAILRRHIPESMHINTR